MQLSFDLMTVERNQYERYYSQLVSLSSLPTWLAASQPQGETSYLHWATQLTQEVSLWYSSDADQIRWQEDRWSTHTADTLLNRYGRLGATACTLQARMQCKRPSAVLPLLYFSIFIAGGWHKSATFVFQDTASSVFDLCSYNCVMSTFWTNMTMRLYRSPDVYCCLTRFRWIHLKIVSSLASCLWSKKNKISRDKISSYYQ